MKAESFAVIYERDGEGWMASVPDLPGCLSGGNSLAEAEINIREAIEGVLLSLVDDGEPVPIPTYRAGMVSVRAAS